VFLVRAAGRVGGFLRERGRHTMHRQTQGQWDCNSRTAHGSTDWQALELQLNRTRTILQEILLHLQDVLRNLKMARGAGRPCGASARPETAGSRFAARDARPGESRHRSQPGPASHGGRDKRFSSATAAGSKPHAGPAGTSERPWTRTRPGFDAKTESGPQARPGPAGEEAGRRAAGDNASFRTASAAGSANRERPRAESAFRAKTGSAGHDRDARHGHAAGARPGPSAGRPSGSAAGPAGSQPGSASGQSRRHASADSSQTGQAGARASAGFRTAQASGRAASARSQERAAGGFRLDSERQHRAREIARKAGMNLKCAYDILCLDYPCSVDEIKGAYRQMARLHHPDLGGDEEAMKDVNVAYELAMRFSAGPRRASAAWAV